MIAKFGDTMVYHQDELLELADPVGSTRIPCVLVRRIHPTAGDYFFFTNSAYVKDGIFIIDEFDPEFDEEVIETCTGTVCMDALGRADWWRDMGKEWCR